MGRRIRIKTADEIAVMRRAGELVARTLRLLAEAIRPGVTTAELDRLAETHLRDHGATPSFLGYGDFPASICASVNDRVVHGIPNRTPLREGDIVGIDLGAYLDGFHADSALTVPVPPIHERTSDLLAVTEASLRRGIARAKPGNRLGEISHAIQEYVEKRGFSVVRELVGHGIGRDLHEDPQVPNFGPPQSGPILRPGMALAIEPMINEGTRDVKVMPDKWTIVTMDGRCSAHFEHTIVITQGEPEVITLPPSEEKTHSNAA